MAEAVYLLCALTSLLCASLLLWSYRRTPMPLVLWTSLAFVGLTANNVLLFVDLILVPETNLSIWRNAAGLAGISVLLYGMITTEGT